jgi:hypothetical protein
MRKTITKKSRKNMFSGGLGRFGPYLLGSRKITKKVNVKASVGTRGKIIGAKYVGKSASIALEHNLTTGKTSLIPKLRKKKR